MVLVVELAIMALLGFVLGRFGKFGSKFYEPIQWLIDNAGLMVVSQPKVPSSCGWPIAGS